MTPSGNSDRWITPDGDLFDSREAALEHMAMVSDDGATIEREPQRLGPREPPRGRLSPEVEVAARTIHRAVWNAPYEAGRGPMHFAGGSYWHDELLRQADEWERLAQAARVCASALPDALEVALTQAAKEER